MNVNEDRLIKNLKEIQDKLRDNDLLSEENHLTIEILIAHLEELKEGDDTNG